MGRLLPKSGNSSNSSRTKKLNKEQPANNENYTRIVVIGLLASLSVVSIYTIVAKVGLQQFSDPASLLLSSQASAPQVISTTNYDPSVPHHKRQSPPHILQNPLGIPQGQAQALPSIRIVDKKEEARREGATKYGGKGDKQHLGGFTTYDRLGVSPATWRHMITHIGVKSVMDVGCGKGVSTLYFAEHGVDVLCLEGSHDAAEQTLLPNPDTQVVEHDFSRGPYWPANTYDAVWSVEFLEHVGRNFQYNYIQAFRKAALIFVTHSRWGGWHHVEVHTDDWWLNKFEFFGFHYSERLTNRVRQVATEEMHIAKASPDKPENQGPDGEYWNAQHVWLTMLVFVNPAVASLPEHAHLMAEPGCYEGKSKPNQIIHRDCRSSNQESELPDSYSPLKLTPEQQAAWFAKVKSRIEAANQ